jgi:hypothetical protein
MNEKQDKRIEKLLDKLERDIQRMKKRNRVLQMKLDTLKKVRSRGIGDEEGF